MLKRYCAWHQKLFGKELLISEIPSEQDGTTHGICDECYKVWENEVGAYFGGFSIYAPNTITGLVFWLSVDDEGWGVGGTTLGPVGEQE